MTESGDIVHGTNKMRFESASVLDREGWMTINTKMKDALRLIEKREHHQICGGR